MGRGSLFLRYFPSPPFEFSVSRFLVMRHLLFLFLIFSCVPTVLTAECRPVTYYLGTIDERFGVSREEALTVLDNAAAFFSPHVRLDPLGDVRVDFVYTQTQKAYEEIDALKRAGQFTEDKKQALADSHKQFAILAEQYKRKARRYEEKVLALNTLIQTTGLDGSHKRSLDLDIDHERTLLEKERTSLEAEAKNLREIQNRLNAQSASLNSSIENLNESIRSSQERYGRGLSYDNAGLYEYNEKGRTITVFLHKDPEQLTALIAHELGHALGLQHVTDKHSLMNPLQTTENERLAALSPTDVAELLRVCQTKNTLK
jgi:uncharacterized protein YjaZ